MTLTLPVRDGSSLEPKVHRHPILYPSSRGHRNANSAPTRARTLFPVTFSDREVALCARPDARGASSLTVRLWERIVNGDEQYEPELSQEQQR
jgi:hypothetical protein